MNLNLKEIILIFLKGLFMGSADIVPGVSGGTIALITGIYERLISAISSIRFSFLKPLLKANFSEFKEKLIFRYRNSIHNPCKSNQLFAWYSNSIYIFILLRSYIGFCIYPLHKIREF